MRLFIAIELPAELKAALGRLRAEIAGARWVPGEQIHLTLAFLGEVAEERLEQLTAALARIQSSPFRLSFSGTGCFPDHRRPRVLWIGLEPEAHLQQLAAQTHAALLACGIPQEERPFSPHITLARLKMAPPGAADRFLHQQKQTLSPFAVQEFTLFQSRLTPQGALHTPLRVFPLAAATGNAERH